MKSSYEGSKDAEKELVVEKFDALNKVNQCNRGLVLAEKCSRCGLVHPRIRFHWKKERDGCYGLHIHIPCPDEAFVKKLFAVEKLLSEIGFHFDTGYGGVRDWEFDWCLYGDHFQWDEEKKEYVKVESRSK